MEILKNWHGLPKQNVIFKKSIKQEGFKKKCETIINYITFYKIHNKNILTIKKVKN